MKYSEDIKLEIGGKFINGDYHKNLKLLIKDLDKLIKSAKSEQLLIQRRVSQCTCAPDETTGTTSIHCCNICGKPTESFWRCGLHGGMVS